MATYAIIGLVFIAITTLTGRLYKIKHWRAALVAGIAVAILTLHFEPAMISFGLYEHDSTKILGILVRGLIPIEDFLYVVFAALIVPSLWDRFEHDNAHSITYTTKDKS